MNIEEKNTENVVKLREFIATGLRDDYTNVRVSSMKTGF